MFKNKKIKAKVYIRYTEPHLGKNRLNKNSIDNSVPFLNTRAKNVQQYSGSFQPTHDYNKFSKFFSRSIFPI